MRYWLAALWLLAVATTGAYLAWRIADGLTFRTDLLALLPREEQDPVLQQANELVSKALARRLLVLIGHADRERARSAAQSLSDALVRTGVVEPAGADADQMKRMGELYFPHRSGLLSDADRQLLADGQGDTVAMRALARVFGPLGFGNAALLRADPFLLLPGFLAGLPVPLSRLTLDDGMLSVSDQGTHWVLVRATVNGNPMALDIQETVVTALDAAASTLQAQVPGLQLKRLGTVFFAHAGAELALAESTTIGAVGMAGVVLLILLVFRRLTPLLHNLLALTVGTGMALGGSLAVFGELHVAALLFGSGLIGVAVDYGLHYSAHLFDPATAKPRDRLHHVLPGICMGLGTTLIGYLALLAAPFPGLQQIAVFSTIGLLAAFATVVMWVPLLDPVKPVSHGRHLLAMGEHLWSFWEHRRFALARKLLLAALGIAGVVGLARLTPDDDVRRLQALSPALLRDQQDVQQLIGAATASQFLLVRADSDEAALQLEESLTGRLEHLRRDGALAGYQMPAAYVPSARRQQENAALVQEKLTRALLTPQLVRLGLPPADMTAATTGVLSLGEAISRNALPFVGELVLAPGLHVVSLEGLARPEAVRAALAGVPGVRLVDPTADFSALLGKYRDRALYLTLLSAILIALPLIWRYGWRGALRAMTPPLIAVVLAPALVALGNGGFTFFHAMALILILSIGVDYAIFCAESDNARRSITVLGTWLASVTTILSFGLLAFSEVFAVRSFGLTMLVGILIAFILCPLAAPAARTRSAAAR